MSATAPLSPFVGREEELQRIETGIAQWASSHVIIIEGPGGIGKSRLLEEVYRQRQHYANLLNGRLRATQVINLDDINLQLPMNLSRRLAREVAAAYFQPYFDKTDESLFLESQGKLSPEALERHLHENDDAFLQCYEAVADKERVVLLLDTAEAILQLPLGRYLTKLTSKLDNTLILIATRDGDKAYDLLNQAIRESDQQLSLERISLKGFSTQTAQDYFGQTPVSGYLASLPNVRENLVLLTNGVPLLLTLAAEWLRRGIVFPELGKPPDELRQLPPDEMGRVQLEFEEALATSIRSLDAPLGNLVLNMAYLSTRFDAEMLAAIDDTSIEGSAKLLNDALSGLFFAKKRSDGSFVLHDEVQRLVDKYVWPEWDPFGTRRKQLGQEAIENYRQRLPKVQQDLIELEKRIAIVEDKKDIAQSAELHRSYVERRRMQWTFRREMLHYALQVDPVEGYKLFRQGFDDATESEQPLVREGFVQEIIDRQLNLTIEQDYEVRIRLVRYYNEKAEFATAYEQAQGLLKAFPIQDERCVNIMIQLANAAIRLNRLQKGNDWFKESLQACQKYNITDKDWFAKSENGLGWSYRLLGQLDQAVEHYQNAFGYVAETNNRELATQVLNNLGYAHYLKGDKLQALRLCQQALDLAGSLGQHQQVSAINSTLGEINLGLGRFDDAIGCYEKALAYFEKTYNNEWQAIVHSEISHAKRHWASRETCSETGQKALLRDALTHARDSVRLCEQNRLLKDTPLCYYEIGRVLLDLGELDEAKMYLEKSYPLNRERPGSFPLADLTGLAEIAYRQQDYPSVDKWVKESQSLPQSERADSALFTGRLLRILAESQLKRGDLDNALGTYIEALSFIARQGGYGAYRLELELDRLKRNIAELPATAKADWCNRFISRWQQEGKTIEVITAVQLAKFI
jgi:tetratricopeptide (TPR) repeat protein